MIDAFAKKMADEFFGNLQTALAGSTPAPIIEAASASAEVAATIIGRPTSSPSNGNPQGEGTRVLWFTLGVGATAFGFWLAHLLR